MVFKIKGKMQLSIYDSVLAIPISDRRQAENLINEQEQAKYPYTVEIKQKRFKRSRNANNYAWELITRIADIISTSKEECYVEMLKRYGQQGVVSVGEEEQTGFERATQYFEHMGESQLNGKTFHHYKFFIGSSQYDTKEMSVLVDGIVSEAKELGIETATPQELERLKGEWQP